MTTSAQTKTQTIQSPAIPETIMVGPLREIDKNEVVDFLSLRPINNVILSGWIHDHGIVSQRHRGNFYGCRDTSGDLTGVAMIGRNLLFETCTDEAIAAFARCARNCTDIRMIFAEDEKLKTFWRHYGGKAPMPRTSRHRLITSGGFESNDIEPVMELRIATLKDLEPIVAAHAAMVLDETGVDPLATDAAGFRRRCAQRVEQGRVWVWMNGGDLIFKIDVVSDTPGVIYTEGLWVDPQERGKGYGTRCFQ